MPINPVSFKGVTAVFGKHSKIVDLHNSLLKQSKEGSIMIQDVTDYYRYAPSWGVLAQAAQRGEDVNIYITGDDVVKVKTNQPGWERTESVLARMSCYYNLKETPVYKAAREIKAKN